MKANQVGTIQYFRDGYIEFHVGKDKIQNAINLIKEYLLSINLSGSARTTSLPRGMSTEAFGMIFLGLQKGAKESRREIEQISTNRLPLDVEVNLSGTHPINIARVQAEKENSHYKISVRFQNHTGDETRPLHFKQYSDLLKKAAENKFKVSGKKVLEDLINSFKNQWKDNVSSVKQNMAYFSEQDKERLVKWIWPDIYSSVKIDNACIGLHKGKYADGTAPTNTYTEWLLVEKAKKSGDYSVIKKLPLTEEEEKALKLGIPKKDVLKAWYDRRQIEGFNNCHEERYHQDVSAPIKKLLKKL